MEPWKDNLAELEERFELVKSEDNSLLKGFYANTTVYRCKKCGSHIMARSLEIWFECQKAWIPQVVICNEYPKCKNHWHLHIASHGEKFDN